MHTKISFVFTHTYDWRQSEATPYSELLHHALNNKYALKTMTVDDTVPVTRKLFGMDRNHPKFVNDEIAAEPNNKKVGNNARRKDMCKNISRANITKGWQVKSKDSKTL